MLVFYLSKKTGFIDGRTGKLLKLSDRNVDCIHNTAVLMYPARSGFSHSLTLSLSLTHAHINTNKQKKLLHVVKSLAGKILDMHDYPDPTTTFNNNNNNRSVCHARSAGLRTDGTISSLLVILLERRLHGSTSRIITKGLRSAFLATLPKCFYFCRYICTFH